MSQPTAPNAIIKKIKEKQLEVVVANAVRGMTMQHEVPLNKTSKLLIRRKETPLIINEEADNSKS